MTLPEKIRLQTLENCVDPKLNMSTIDSLISAMAHFKVQLIGLKSISTNYEPINPCVIIDKQEYAKERIHELRKSLKATISQKDQKVLTEYLALCKKQYQEELAENKPASDKTDDIETLSNKVHAQSRLDCISVAVVLQREINAGKGGK